MGQSWVVSADLLARSRFVISPVSETVAALTVLSRPDPPGAPWIRSFRALHREAYLAMLAEDKLRAVVADHAWRPRRGQVPGWIADFLALPPLGDDATFTDELDQLAAWDDDRIRAEIQQFAVGPLPAALGRPGLRDAVADVLRWVWTTTLVSDWPRRRRVRHERRGPHPAEDVRHRVAQPWPTERRGQRADGELADLGPDPVVVPGRELIELVGERGTVTERRQPEEVRYPARHLATPRPPHVIRHHGAQLVLGQHAEAGLAVQRAERPDPRHARRRWPAQDHQRGDRLAEGRNDEPAARQQVGAYHPALPHVASASALRRGAPAREVSRPPALSTRSFASS